MNQPADPNQSPNQRPGQHPDGVPAPKRKSVWTPKQKLVRALWGTLGRALWVMLPRARPSLLRLFGGRVGQRCTLARNIDIVVPWNITMGDDVVVEDRAILYGLGPIVIGDGCVIDSKAHICAGTHDMTDPMFPLIKPPITLGKGCFVGFDAYIGPEVVLGDRTIVHARSSVYRSTEPCSEWRGNPAKQVEPGEEGAGEDAA
ncbi:MAG: acetyltransferase [Phycisphaerales bacterium JB052]